MAKTPGAAAVDTLRRKGFGRLLVDGAAVAFEDLTPAQVEGRPVLSVVIDRLRTAADQRSRITDSVEIAYQEGGGAAWVVQLGDDGAADTRHVFSERFECRACSLPYEDPQPRLFSFNNPFGACPTCHGFGNIIELDLDLVVPDPAKSIAQGAIEPWTKPHYRTYLADLKKAAKALDLPLDAAVAATSRPQQRHLVVDGDGAGVDGHPRLLRLARAQEIQGARARVPEPLPRLSDVPGLRRHAAAARGARGARGRADHRPGVGAHHAAGADVLRGAGAQPAGSGHRREGAGRDPAAPRLPERRRARLPHARPPVVHAVGRRGAAHQPGHVARRVARRHALRARRAVDRPAPARQPAAHRHPAAVARPGQLGAGRGTRRRHDCRGRPRGGHGPRRRRTRRPRDLQRAAGRSRASSRARSPPSTCAASCRFRCRSRGARARRSACG